MPEKLDVGDGRHPRGYDNSTADLASGMPDGATRQNRPENIKILVRIRPLLARETGPVAVVGQEGGKMIRVNGSTANRQLKCCYDAVIGPEVSQDGMFSHVHDCTAAVLAGENSTIFAYGQTGSGKTYTMFGPESDANGAVVPGHGKGVIPLAVTDLFKGLSSHGTTGAVESSVWVSLVQLYNEQLYDMLRDPQRVHPLAIHEQPDAGIYVQGLSEYAVHNARECLQLLKVGSEHRAIRETHMNQASSRSHSIFQIVVEQKRRSEQDGERVLRSKFNLVDLAGSEKWDVKQDMEEDRVNEMTNINVSLYTLGRVIATLSSPISSTDGGPERNRQPHIPYRDSKLTRLLQDSFGGNTRTRIIATLSPAIECLDETISTLRFADRAKQVMTFVRVNEHRPVDHALVRRLQAEVRHLRSVLRDTTANYNPDKETTDGASQPPAFTAIVEAQQLGYQERYQETIEQLRRENTALRESTAPTLIVRSGDQNALGSDVATLQATNRGLEGALERVVGNVRRFFRFEIEEEDLRIDLDRVLVHLNGSIPGGVSWYHANNSGLSLDFAAAAPQNNRGGIGTNMLPIFDKASIGQVENTSPDSRAVLIGNHRRGDIVNRAKPSKDIPAQAERVSLPPMPGVASGLEPRSEKLAYRVRGKHADEVMVVMKKEVTEEDEERRLKKELKLAKERMKKNLQLQEWLLQKEQREIEVLASESAKRHEIDRDRRRRDEEFLRRAAKQKAKLKRFYETAQTEARRETERSDYEVLYGHGQVVGTSTDGADSVGDNAA